MNRDALIIFARKPERGKVKTRLGATVGDDKALEIYMRLLQHTRAVAQSLVCEVHVFVAGNSDDGFWDGCILHRQQGGHLGERMLHAFHLLFTGGCTRAMIIGTDCPGLSSNDVETAFAQLQHDDVVIGPALDGGYYLLGMNTLHPALFRWQDWSHNQVFSRTIDEAKHAALTVGVLRMLQDVDEEEDVPEAWL